MSANKSISPQQGQPNYGKRALHFGAGNIGRGFIGPLLVESGFTVTFADVIEKIITALKTEGKYNVQIVAEKSHTETISGVEGIMSTSPDLIDLLAKTGDGEVKLITTSVGPLILPRLAGSIAAGLEKRKAAGGSKLNVIACENLVGATHKMQEYVLQKLEGKADVLEWVKENVGWANCAVDRIVPPVVPGEQSLLDVGVEPFYEWTVDQTALKGDLKVHGMKVVNNLEAYVERKLYTLNCGHASLAYLGSLKGLKTIDVALKDAECKEILKGVFAEGGAALVKKHGFNANDHQAYIESILERFANPVLKDDLVRVGREPLRKLSPRDRLVGPTNMVRGYGFERKNLLKAIAAALHFHSTEDPQSIKLQEQIQKEGVEATLKEASGWGDAEKDDIAVVLKEYENFKSWKSKA